MRPHDSRNPGALRVAKRFAALALVPALAAFLTGAADADLAKDLTETETVRETFELEPADGRRQLIVDTLWGGVRVAGADRTTVAVRAERTVLAESARWLERARTEVELDVYRPPGTLELFVDGPWRSKIDRREWAGHHVELGYEVHYDFEIEVPRNTDVQLRTVLDGDLVLRDVDGEHRLVNVTGDVRFDGVSGSGRFESVSGSVRGDFQGSPRAASTWKTISGEVEVALPADLAADLVISSQWGEAWSEHALEALPAPVPVARRKRGKYVLRTGGEGRFRIGSGGTELRFETLSGDIRILKRVQAKQSN